MAISRQKIYKASPVMSFFKSKSSKLVQISKYKLSCWLANMLGYNPIFLGRARAGLYLATLLIFRNEKGVCLMSPLTILDVANMVSGAGAAIEYYDLRSGLFECDVTLLEMRLKKGDVRQLIITHYFYIQEDIAAIVELCNKYNVSLVEDCAISLGARHGGKFSGSFGRFAVFSFSIFKFLNNFWGGAIVCKTEEDKRQMQAIVSNWRCLNYIEYFPQFFKYIKFGAVTVKPIFALVFHVFKYGIENNIKFIINNIQNDPYVPYSKYVPENCLTLPHDSFYVELGSKLSKTSANMDSRRLKAAILLDLIRNKEIVALPKNIDLQSASLISFPLIFESEAQRNAIAAKLLSKGIDCSKQLYRNIATVSGYDLIPGECTNVQNLIERCLYLPIHNGVSFESLPVMSEVLNGDI